MIEDLEAIGPVSEIGGFRRRVFYTSGQPWVAWLSGTRR
jgi:hypothetical protein